MIVTDNCNNTNGLSLLGLFSVFSRKIRTDLLYNFILEKFAIRDDIILSPVWVFNKIINIWCLHKTSLGNLLADKLYHGGTRHERSVPPLILMVPSMLILKAFLRTLMPFKLVSAEAGKLGAIPAGRPMKIKEFTSIFYCVIYFLSGEVYLGNLRQLWGFSASY